MYAANSNDTKTDPSHVEKKFPKRLRQKKATAKFKEQLNKVKDDLGAMRAGMYMLVWNAVLTKLMGEHPDQSFDYVDSKGLPF